MAAFREPTAKLRRRHRGLEDKGDVIEVLDLPIEPALCMSEHGTIVDGKTIMPLPYARLKLFPA